MPTIYRDILAPGGRHADPDPSARIAQPHNTGLSIVPKQNRPRRPRTTIRRFMKCRVTGAAGSAGVRVAPEHVLRGSAARIWATSPECRRTSMNAKQVRGSDGSGCWSQSEDRPLEHQPLPCRGTPVVMPADQSAQHHAHDAVTT
jgi:hypothetical protein